MSTIAEVRLVDAPAPPLGWGKAWDAHQQKVYFYDAGTNTSVWHIEDARSLAALQAAPDPPVGWAKVYKSGCVRYRHAGRGEECSYVSEAVTSDALAAAGDPGPGWSSVWSPDEQRVLFRHDQTGRLADTLGAVTAMNAIDNAPIPGSGWARVWISEGGGAGRVCFQKCSTGEVVTTIAETEAITAAEEAADLASKEAAATFAAAVAEAESTLAARAVEESLNSMRASAAEAAAAGGEQAWADDVDKWPELPVELPVACAPGGVDGRSDNTVVAVVPQLTEPSAAAGLEELPYVAQSSTGTENPASFPSTAGGLGEGTKSMPAAGLAEEDSDLSSSEWSDSDDHLEATARRDNSHAEGDVVCGAPPDSMAAQVAAAMAAMGARAEHATDGAGSLGRDDTAGFGIVLPEAGSPEAGEVDGERASNAFRKNPSVVSAGVTVRTDDQYTSSIANDLQPTAAAAGDSTDTDWDELEGDAIEGCIITQRGAV